MKPINSIHSVEHAAKSESILYALLTLTSKPDLVAFLILWGR